MRFGVLILIFALFAAKTGLAADASGRLAVRGVGAMSCEQFAKAFEERGNALQQIGGWFDGYITGANQYNSNTYDIAPWEATLSMLLLVKRNCERKPEARLFNIAKAMVAGLMQDRLQEHDKKNVITVAGKKVAVYGKTMRRVQGALKKLGHYDQDIDGSFGPGTQSAIESYQLREGIPVTGLPDQPTLWKLLRPVKKSQ